MSFQYLNMFNNVDTLVQFAIGHGSKTAHGSKTLECQGAFGLVPASSLLISLFIIFPSLMPSEP